MYELKYRRKSKRHIIEFIDAYKDNFLNRFSNTGLFYEDIIRRNYIENANQFKTDIRKAVEKNLTYDQILGYSTLENKNLEIICRAGNYRLFIEYSEKRKSKIRIVEDIRFHKA